jgi:hypothetical protein
LCTLPRLYGKNNEQRNTMRLRAVRHAPQRRGAKNAVVCGTMKIHSLLYVTAMLVLAQFSRGAVLIKGDWRFIWSGESTEESVSGVSDYFDEKLVAGWDVSSYLGEDGKIGPILDLRIGGWFGDPYDFYGLWVLLEPWPETAIVRDETPYYSWEWTAVFTPKEDGGTWDGIYAVWTPNCPTSVVPENSAGLVCFSVVLIGLACLRRRLS